jgi:hypothetical protein
MKNVTNMFHFMTVYLAGKYEKRDSTCYTHLLPLGLQGNRAARDLMRNYLANDGPFVSAKLLNDELVALRGESGTDWVSALTDRACA